MKASLASVTIKSLSPLSQSRQHDAPRLEGESHDAYDARTWRNKMHVETVKGASSVVIPGPALHQCIAFAAKYSKKQIPGQGKATWTGKFTAGVMIHGNAPLMIDPATVPCVTISANADGVRGSGKRVTRRFPTVAAWETTFDVWILDPIIIESVFREMIDIAGMFVGVGQFRPQNMGSNGRFVLSRLDWQDNRQIAA